MMYDKMMDYDKYSSLITKFQKCDDREINYQNRIIIPFLEMLLEKDGYDIVDVSTQYKNRETKLHTRKLYANNCTPDLLIAKNWNIKNKDKNNIEYCAVVEIKIPTSDFKYQIKDYLKADKISKVIWTNCIKWEFYHNSNKPTKSITLNENTWNELCDYLIEFLNYPFYDAPDTAVITCRHIIEDGEPVLYVSHDSDDGMWQFLCGKSHDTDDARVVSLLDIFSIDNSVG